MQAFYAVAVAVLCNVSAQVALKMGATTEVTRLQTWLSPAILIGLALYGLSFVLTIRIYASFPLSVISPIMAGAIFSLVALASVVFFFRTSHTTKSWRHRPDRGRYGRYLPVCLSP